MKLCVIGGGNIGTLIAAEAALSGRYEVALLASRASEFSADTIISYVDSSSKCARIDLITADAELAVAGADLVLITVPPNVAGSVIARIEHAVKPGAYIGFVPGSGGVEFLVATLTSKGCQVFGLERVPSIARFEEYGRAVQNLGRKDRVRFGAVGRYDTRELQSWLATLFGVPCDSYPHYLNVTFTPSNQILHTARIYQLFSQRLPSDGWDDPILFYRTWDDEASRVLVACDRELQELCSALPGADLSGVVSLLNHYEVGSPEEMTHKIRSIRAFKDIQLPMIEQGDRFYPDISDRYFTSDFTHGLMIIKGFAIAASADTPMIDKVLRWYLDFMQFAKPSDSLESVVSDHRTGAPQRFGYRTLDEIMALYAG